MTKRKSVRHYNIRDESVYSSKKHFGEGNKIFGERNKSVLDSMINV